MKYYLLYGGIKKQENGDDSIFLFCISKEDYKPVISILYIGFDNVSCLKNIII